MCRRRDGVLADPGAWDSCRPTPPKKKQCRPPNSLQIQVPVQGWIYSALTTAGRLVIHLTSAQRKDRIFEKIFLQGWSSALPPPLDVDSPLRPQPWIRFRDERLRPFPANTVHFYCAKVSSVGRESECSRPVFKLQRENGEWLQRMRYIHTHTWTGLLTHACTTVIHSHTHTHTRTHMHAHPQPTVHTRVPTSSHAHVCTRAHAHHKVARTPTHARTLPVMARRKVSNIRVPGSFGSSSDSCPKMATLFWCRSWYRVSRSAARVRS